MGTMSFRVRLYVGILLLQKVFCKSISDETTIENRTDTLEKSFESLMLRINNISDILTSLQASKYSFIKSQYELFNYFIF